MFYNRIYFRIILEKTGVKWDQGVARGASNNTLVELCSTQGVAKQHLWLLKGAQDRTSFDNLVELCSTQGVAWPAGLTNHKLVRRGLLTRATLEYGKQQHRRPVTRAAANLRLATGPNQPKVGKAGASAAGRLPLGYRRPKITYSNPNNVFFEAKKHRTAFGFGKSRTKLSVESPKPNKTDAGAIAITNRRFVRELTRSTSSRSAALTNLGFIRRGSQSTPYKTFGFVVGAAALPTGLTNQPKVGNRATTGRQRGRAPLELGRLQPQNQKVL